MKNELVKNIRRLSKYFYDMVNINREHDIIEKQEILDYLSFDINKRPWEKENIFKYLR